MTAPLVIAVAPTGARRTKADHPLLPIGPEEIARDAAACRDAGASLLHLHVRDERGRHSLDAGRYREALAAVRAAVGNTIAVQVTTEAAGRYGAGEQMALLRELRPEAASVALREMVPDAAAEARAASFYHWAAEAGIAIQPILYEPAEVLRLLDLRRREVIPDGPTHPLFVLGRYAPDGESNPAALLAFLDVWPRDRPWSVCAFGRAETAALAVAIGLGGHARVGFENSIVKPDGSVATDNREAVARVAALSTLVGRPVAPAKVARTIYGLRPDHAAS